MEIIIKGDDKKLLKQVEDLARKLGLKITRKRQKTETPNGAKLTKLMKEFADQGGVKSIPDPIKWQDETRKDRPLQGRE